MTQLENMVGEAPEAADKTLDDIISAALEQQEASEPPAEEEAQTVIEAPGDWPEEEKAVFAALPPGAQEMVLKQYKNFQAGFTRKSQELSDHARFSEAVRRELEPFRDELSASGIDEAGAVRELVRLYGLYRKDPHGYARMVAGRTGLYVCAG